jgi:hypothetical protein
LHAKGASLFLAGLRRRSLAFVQFVGISFANPDVLFTAAAIPGLLLSISL